MTESLTDAERIVIRAYQMWLVEHAPWRPTDDDAWFEEQALEHVVAKFPMMSRERIVEIIAKRGST